MIFRAFSHETAVCISSHTHCTIALLVTACTDVHITSRWTTSCKWAARFATIVATEFIEFHLVYRASRKRRRVINTERTEMPCMLFRVFVSRSKNLEVANGTNDWPMGVGWVHSHSNVVPRRHEMKLHASLTIQGSLVFIVIAHISSIDSSFQFHRLPTFALGEVRTVRFPVVPVSHVERAAPEMPGDDSIQDSSSFTHFLKRFSHLIQTVLDHHRLLHLPSGDALAVSFHGCSESGFREVEAHVLVCLE